MKKLLALVLAVVMMLGIASVAFAETAATDSVDSLQAVLDSGVLKVGVDADFAPLTYKDADGNIVGYDIDVMNAVAEKLGVTVVLIEIDWADMTNLLNTGAIDCVWSGLEITDTRAAEMTLSTAYLASTTSLLVKDSSVASLADLAGKTIAVQAGSSIEEMLCSEEFADFTASVTLVGVKDYTASVAALTADASAEVEVPSANDALVAADAVVVDGLVAKYQVVNDPALAGCTVIDDTLSADMIGIAFAKGNYKLCGAVEEVLYGLAQDGTLATITTEWFGEDISLIGK